MTRKNGAKPANNSSQPSRLNLHYGSITRGIYTIYSHSTIYFTLMITSHFRKGCQKYQSMSLRAILLRTTLTLMIITRNFKKPRRQRQRKRHLKTKVRVTYTSSRLFQFVQLVQCGRTIQQQNRWERRSS